MGDVSTKLIVAYEEQSSSTMRLTPEAIGRLLSAVPDAEFHRVFEQFFEESRLLGADRRHHVACEFDDISSRLFAFNGVSHGW